MAEGIKAGQVTTIRNPYRGKVPTQTARQSTTPVQVSRDSLTTAQNRIAGARRLESSMPGQSFKSSLKNAYKGVFKAAKGVPVEGMTFNGKQYTADIPNSVPGKVISDSNLTAEKLALLDNLSDVVRNGEYVGSGEYVAHGAKTKNTVRYDYFETPVEINGKPYIASFDVEVFPNTNNYRTHKLNEIELSPSTSADTGRDPAANVGRTAQFEGTRPLDVDSTIAQENVKTDPLLQLLSGGKRAELNALSDAQRNAVYQANEDGTVGMAACCTIGGHSVYSWGLKFLSASFVASAKMMEPVFASVWALLLFREVPGPLVLLGGAVVIFGIALYSRIASGA